MNQGFVIARGILAFTLLISLGSLVLHSAWNSVIPHLTSLPSITFGQALSLLCLKVILLFKIDMNKSDSSPSVKVVKIDPVDPDKEDDEWKTNIM